MSNRQFIMPADKDSHCLVYMRMTSVPHGSLHGEQRSDRMCLHLLESNT